MEQGDGNGREEAVRQLRAETLRLAERSSLLEESQASVAARIRELVQRNGSSVVFKSERPESGRQ